jgi:hypothetical protein
MNLTDFRAFCAAHKLDTANAGRNWSDAGISSAYLCAIIRDEEDFAAIKQLLESDPATAWVKPSASDLQNCKVWPMEQTTVHQIIDAARKSIRLDTHDYPHRRRAADAQTPNVQKLRQFWRRLGVDNAMPVAPMHVAALMPFAFAEGRFRLASKPQPR